VIGDRRGNVLHLLIGIKRLWKQYRRYLGRFRLHRCWRPKVSSKEEDWPFKTVMGPAPKCIAVAHRNDGRGNVHAACCSRGERRAGEGKRDDARAGAGNITQARPESPPVKLL